MHGTSYGCSLGYNVEKLSPSHFELSEEKSQRVATSVASSWNSAVNILKSLANGNDGILFLKVLVSCFLLSLSYVRQAFHFDSDDAE